MRSFTYGDPGSNTILIQMTGDHELSHLEEEVRLIKETSPDFCLIALQVDHWNDDLSPWEAPAVFGKDGFGGKAEETLKEVLTFLEDGKEYCIGGYSLAGLFALWAGTKTDRFRGIAAASPSAWFPGFIEHLKENPMKSKTVYLSLGDREEKTGNPVMKTVGGRIREIHGMLRDSGIQTVLEWNPGNHFKDPGPRTARAFGYLLEERADQMYANKMLTRT